ncbi:hypothetical protein FRB91_009807 [Serendipita sp. 411]|nr:hypothetical protein FRC16_009875 [Serendipita sp. 398]KAG8828130.1 hypothetical protein FRC19_009214 [Serendipita sp. 401]KAG8836071.1 hypothetical protein FRC18_011894 [Serendipita sp. 400]KAG8849518.1 hypothetical protein FRB91_009807 [Serendipita sp. 411]KAG8859944.1 hypothetical protein FRC20_011737 [Serendipita sp. 405]KAG9058436.1 hypothetical protein FS842_009504 [Serendipita sp. 407]
MVSSRVSIHGIEVARARELSRAAELITGIHTHYDHCLRERQALAHETEDPLRDRISNLQRLNELQLSLIAPIGQLPFEILSQIFYEYTLMDGSLEILVLVSARWKEIALSVPSVWSRILVSDNKWDACKRQELGSDAGSFRALGSYQICSTNVDLEAALMRSRAALLSLRIELVDSRDAFLSTHETEEMLIRLMGTQFSERTREIDLFVTTGSRVAVEPIVKVMTGKYISLDTLRLDAHHRSWITLYAPRLMGSLVRVENLYVRKSSMIEALSKSNLMKIQRLEISSVPLSSEFNKICNKMENLKAFPSIADWPNSSTPFTIFNHLSFLILRCRSIHLTQLRLPSLQRMLLTLNDNQHPGATVQSGATPWDLPALVRLDLFVFSAQLFTWLPSISAPNLQELTIRRYDTHTERFPPTQFPKLHSLKIYGSGPNEWFIEPLVCIPGVRSVHLEPRRCVTIFGELLFTQLANPELCPVISDITVGGELYPLNGEKAMLEPLIARVAAVHSGRLSQFIVYWPSAEGPRATRYIS